MPTLEGIGIDPLNMDFGFFSFFQMGLTSVLGGGIDSRASKVIDLMSDSSSQVIFSRKKIGVKKICYSGLKLWVTVRESLFSLVFSKINTIP